MGRYYTGDIDGKFWFGVQPSDDADFFGVTGEQPSELIYYFDEEDKENIEDGIKKCLEAMGEYKEKLDDFFKQNNGYKDEMLEKFGIPREDIRRLLSWYARLELGEKILKCVKENGSCEFTAEC